MLSFPFILMELVEFVSLLYIYILYFALLLYPLFSFNRLSVSMLCFTLMIGYELSASIEPIISPVVLNMWASHISDPFICIDAIEVMEVIMWSIVGNNIFKCPLTMFECTYKHFTYILQLIMRIGWTIS